MLVIKKKKAQKQKNTKSKPLIIPIGKKEKSKSRSVSCTKNQQNNKVKINKNKPFISMNEDPEKSTINDKRVHHQSLYSLQEIEKITTKKKKKLSPKLKKKLKINQSESFILKNEAIRKREAASVLQQKKKSREKLIKYKCDKKFRPLHSTSMLTNKEKKINSHNSLKQYSILALQSLFQNHSNLMSVTSSGQIEFSSKIESHLSEEKRQIFEENLRITIKDPNLLLNINVKKQYKKKVAAVTKIQKIWRGYQTRKLLKQYIFQQQPKLVKMLEQFKGYNHQEQKISENQYNRHNQGFQQQEQYQQNNTHNYSEQIKMQNEIQENFINREQRISHFQEKSLTLNTIKHQNISQYKNILDDISAIKLDHQSSKYVTFQKQSIQQEKIEERNVFQPEEFQYEEDSQEGQQGQQNLNLHIYRRQKPIFSHEDLNEYLKESKEKQQQQQQYDQEEQQKDIHQPKIILETSEEYIQTRKTSMQQKKGGKKQNDIESRKVSYETFPEQLNPKCLTSLGEQKIQQQDIKETKSIEVSKINKINNDQEINQIMTKQIQQEEKKSTKEDYKQQITKIKHQQINKWGKMIQFIKENLKSNADEEYSKIMNEIVHQSENNKKWLEKNMNKHIKKQIQTVETRITTQQDTFIKKYNKQDFCFSSQKTQNNTSMTINNNASNNSNQILSMNNNLINDKKIHFKKKNLELDLKSIGNSFVPISIVKQQLQLPDIKQKSSEQFSSIKIYNNWNLPLPDQSQDSMRLKKQQHKNSLKNILSSKFNNFSTSNLNDIISIREELLKERQTLEYKKLQNNLVKNEIGVQQFEIKKFNLSKYIENQQHQIQKAKQEIQKGLKMAAKVVAKTQRDAQFLGKSIKLSKSEENIKKIKPEYSHLQLIQGIPSHLYVDERKFNKKESETFKNFFNDDQKSNSSETQSLDLTEQELKRFKDPKFTNLEFIDMNKNIMISQQFLKSHKINSYEKPGKKLKIEINDYEENSEKNPKTVQYVPEIVDEVVNQLILQLTIQLYENPSIFETINMKYQLSSIKPPIISNEQMLKFIQLIDYLLPDQNILLKRLNQKISPSPLQLLKCMRVDLSDQQQNQIDESGKYQFIIPQSICMNAISKFPIKQTAIIQKTDKKQDIEFSKLPSTTKKYIENREKIISIKKQEALKKKKQVFNILMHCIFDSWNQQIITLKTQIPGFSGIGLNESTLSLQNQNIEVAIQQVDKYIEDSRDKVVNIIQDNNQLTKKINIMAYEQMCYNESNWINYSDEALGYFLELDYIIVEQLMAEIARFLQKKMFKETMFNNNNIQIGHPKRLISEI